MRARVVAGVVALVLAVACGTLVVARTAAPGLLPASWSAADRAAERDADLTIAARTFALRFLSFDYRTIDADLDSLETFTTGELAADFGSLGADIADLARKTKAVSTGEVTRVGIGRVTESRASVDVAAQKTETAEISTAEEKPTPRSTSTYPLYFRITLESVGGRWLVSDVRVLRVS